MKNLEKLLRVEVFLTIFDSSFDGRKVGVETVVSTGVKGVHHTVHLLRVPAPFMTML